MKKSMKERESASASSTANRPGTEDREFIFGFNYVEVMADFHGGLRQNLTGKGLSRFWKRREWQTANTVDAFEEFCCKGEQGHR